MILNLLNPNSEFLNLIDWGTITNELQKRANLERSKNNLPLPIKFSTPEELSEYYNLIDNKISLILESPDKSFYSSLKFLAQLEINQGKDINTLVEEVEKNKFFSPKELNCLVFAIETYQDLYGRKEDYLLDQKNKHAFQKQLLKPFRNLSDEHGQVFYNKHPLLKTINEEIETLNIKIRKNIERLLNDELYQNALQVSGYDVIYDRYVLILKSDSYQSKMGSILYHSESGKSLYVEPFEIGKLSNKRIELITKREEVLGKICRDFSNFIFQQRAIVHQMVEKVLLFDELLAKAQFCLDYNLIRPVVFSSEYFPEINIQGLFHPLIEDCVKNDFKIQENKLGQIISGPNTGGKTVLLKSVCLCHLFPHLGIFIPAKYGTIPLVQNIYYLGNDQQKLEEGLSSFSAEARNYCQMLEELSSEGQNLIVIDEIFNSTSSEDASSLAMAFFEQIKEIGNSKIIVSTHHQMLKTLTHEREEYQSSHVGFSLEENKPTYKLINEVPGSSMAIQIFKNISKFLGQSQKIAQNAEKFLDKKLVVYENLLNEISQKNIKLEKLIRENEEININLKNQKKANEGILKLKMQTSHEAYKQKLEKIIEKGQKIISEVKTNRLEPKQARRKLHELDLDHKREKVFSPQISDRLKGKVHVPFEEIKIGKKYFSKMISKNVLVDKINKRKKKVTVLNGNLKVELNGNDFFTPGKEEGNPSSKKLKSFSVSLEAQPEIEIDCRGLRLDEFENLIERQLAYILSEHLPFSTIIHGHGDGILKKWLYQRIKSDGKFIISDAFEGNDGASTIKLK